MEGLHKSKLFTYFSLLLITLSTFIQPIMTVSANSNVTGKKCYDTYTGHTVNGKQSDEVGTGETVEFSYGYKLLDDVTKVDEDGIRFAGYFPEGLKVTDVKVYEYLHQQEKLVELDGVDFIVETDRVVVDMESEKPSDWQDREYHIKVLGTYDKELEKAKSYGKLLLNNRVVTTNTGFLTVKDKTPEPEPEPEPEEKPEEKPTEPEEKPTEPEEKPYKVSIASDIVRYHPEKVGENETYIGRNGYYRDPVYHTDILVQEQVTVSLEGAKVGEDFELELGKYDYDKVKDIGVYTKNGRHTASGSFGEITDDSITIEEKDGKYIVKGTVTPEIQDGFKVIKVKETGTDADNGYNLEYKYTHQTDGEIKTSTHNRNYYPITPIYKELDKANGVSTEINVPSNNHLNNYNEFYETHSTGEVAYSQGDEVPVSRLDYVIKLPLNKNFDGLVLHDLLYLKESTNPIFEREDGHISGKEIDPNRDTGVDLSYNESRIEHVIKDVRIDGKSIKDKDIDIFSKKAIIINEGSWVRYDATITKGGETYRVPGEFYVEYKFKNYEKLLSELPDDLKAGKHLEIVYVPVNNVDLKLHGVSGKEKLHPNTTFYNNMEKTFGKDKNEARKYLSYNLEDSLNKLVIRNDGSPNKPGQKEAVTEVRPSTDYIKVNPKLYGLNDVNKGDKATIKLEYKLLNGKTEVQEHTVEIAPEHLHGSIVELSPVYFYPTGGWNIDSVQVTTSVETKTGQTVAKAKDLGDVYNPNNGRFIYKEYDFEISKKPKDTKKVKVTWKWEGDVPVTPPAPGTVIPVEIKELFAGNVPAVASHSIKVYEGTGSSFHTFKYVKQENKMYGVTYKNVVKISGRDYVVVETKNLNTGNNSTAEIHYIGKDFKDYKVILDATSLDSSNEALQKLEINPRYNDKGSSVTSVIDYAGEKKEIGKIDEKDILSKSYEGYQLSNNGDSAYILTEEIDHDKNEINLTIVENIPYDMNIKVNWGDHKTIPGSYKVKYRDHEKELTSGDGWSATFKDALYKGTNSFTVSNEIKRNLEEVYGYKSNVQVSVNDTTGSYDVTINMTADEDARTDLTKNRVCETVCTGLALNGVKEGQHIIIKESPEEAVTSAPEVVYNREVKAEDLDKGSLVVDKDLLSDGMTYEITVKELGKKDKTIKYTEDKFDPTLCSVDVGEMESDVCTELVIKSEDNGATVKVINKSTKEVEYTGTIKDGKYTLNEEIAMDGQYEVELSKDGHVSKTETIFGKCEIDFGALEKEVCTELTIKLPEEDLDITITDQETGEEIVNETGYKGEELVVETTKLKDGNKYTITYSTKDKKEKEVEYTHNQYECEYELPKLESYCEDFTITSKDEGAKVTVTAGGEELATGTIKDGKLKIEALESDKEYTIEVSKEGYKTKTETILVKEGTCSYNVSALEKDNTCTDFTVNSTDNGAKVVVTSEDGSVHGEGIIADGKLELEALEEGTKYRVTIMKDGYKTVVKNVTAEEGKCEVTLPALEKESVCTDFTIKSNVKDYDYTMTVNGKEVSKSTAKELEEKVNVELVEGDEVVITGTKEGYEDLEVTKVITKGDCTIEITFKEVQKPTEPEEKPTEPEEKPTEPETEVCEDFTVNVNVDGSEVVITDGEGKEFNKGEVTDGKFIVNKPLEVGKEYTVTVTKDGYKTVTKEITGSEENCEVTIELEKLPEEKPTEPEPTPEVCEDFTVKVNVDGSEVVITDSEGKEYGKGEVTDGKFLMDKPLGEGKEYTVTVTKDGYKTVTKEVTGSNDNCELTIELEKLPEEKPTEPEPTPEVCEDFTVNVNKDGAKVVITDSEGNDINKGEVTDGKFLVNKPLEVDKDYTVTVTKDGYKTVTKEVKGSSDNCEVTIELEKESTGGGGGGTVDPDPTPEEPEEPEEKPEPTPTEPEVCTDYTVKANIDGVHVTIVEKDTKEMFAEGEVKGGEFVVNKPLEKGKIYIVTGTKEGYEVEEWYVLGTDKNCYTELEMEVKEDKPTNPEEKPTEPEEKPTEPEEKPTEPEEKPTEPETEVCTETTIKVVDSKTGNHLIRAEVEVIDKETGKTVLTGKTLRDPLVFEEVLEDGKVYTIIAKKTGYRKYEEDYVHNAGDCTIEVEMKKRPSGGGGGGWISPEPIPEPEPTEPEGNEGNGENPEPTEPEGNEGNGENPEPTEPEGNEGDGEKPEPTEPEGNGDKPTPTEPEGNEGNGEKPTPSTPEGNEGNGEKPVPSTPEGNEGSGEKPVPTTPEGNTGGNNLEVEVDTDTGNNNNAVDVEVDTDTDTNAVDVEVDTGNDDEKLPQTNTDAGKGLLLGMLMMLMSAVLYGRHKLSEER